MVDLTVKSTEVQEENLNPLIGSFQRTGGSGVSAAIDGAAAFLSNIGRGSSGPSTTLAERQFDSGLSGALLELDPAVKRDITKDAERLDKMELQGGSRNLRARRIALARQYAEANPGREQTIFNTFKVSTGDDLGAEILSLQEEVEADAVSEMQQLEAKADEFNVPRIGRAQAEWIPELIEAEQLNFKATNLAREKQMIVDGSAISKDKVVTEYRENIVPALMTSLSSGFADNLNYPTSLSDQGTLVDTTSLDPEKVAEDIINIDNTYNQIEASLLQDLSNAGQFTKAEADLILQPLARVRDQAKKLLSGEVTVEAFKNSAEAAETIARSKFIVKNPLVPQTMAMLETISPVMRALSSNANPTAKRQLNDFVTNSLVPVISQAGVNMNSALLSTGIVDEDTRAGVYKTMSKFIMDESNSDLARADAMGTLITNMVSGTELEPRLFHQMIPMLAEQSTKDTIMDSVSAQSANTVQSINIGLQREFNTLKQRYNRQIEEQLGTSVVVGGDRQGVVDPRLGPRVRFADLTEFTSDGNATLNPEAIKELDADEVKKLSDALEEVHRLNSQFLEPLNKAMQNWNMFIERPTPQEDQTVRLEIDGNDS